MAGSQTSSEAHVIQIDQLLMPSQGEIYNTDAGFPLLHKIQPHIQNGNGKAYGPCIISIGPYYHDNPATQSMQRMKWSCLDYVLKLNHEKKINNYLEVIMGLEKDVRGYYASEIKMDSNSVVKMLLLDGCFILMALHGIDQIVLPELSTNMSKAGPDSSEHMNDEFMELNHERAQTRDSPLNDPDSAKQYHTYIIIRDLLLFENQIPFFVITKIYEIVTGGRSKSSHLTENICQYLGDMIGFNQKPVQESNRPKEFYHLLHLCHMHFRPNQIHSETYQNHERSSSFLRIANYLQGLMVLNSLDYWRSAVQYHEAGVILKRKEFFGGRAHSLLDIEFRNGVMEIPCMLVHVNTASLFQNLVAFEQMCPQFGNYITAYVVFWSHFVSKPEDVALLTARGIIVHQLSSDAEVCSLFGSLGEVANFDLNCDNYLKSLSNMMEVHYQNQRPLLKDFFGSIAANVYGRARQKNIHELPVRMPPV